MQAEISPTLTGLDKAGYPESGRALKYRLIRTLAKIGRKRIFYEEGIKKILNLAMQLENVLGINSYEIPKINIVWSDGLPDDYSVKIVDEANRIASGTTSIKSAIKRIDNCSDEVAEAEYQKIMEEKTGSITTPIGKPLV